TGKTGDMEPGLFRREAPLAPIEAAVRVGDVEPGHKQHDQARRVDPVPKPGAERVTLHRDSPSCRARYITSRDWASRCWPESTNRLWPLASGPVARKYAASATSAAAVRRRSRFIRCDTSASSSDWSWLARMAPGASVSTRPGSASDIESIAAAAA